MKLIYVGIFLALMLIAALYYFIVSPDATQRANAATATATNANAGVVKGMPLYAPPSGNTTQNLNGVPGVETYSYPENGGLPQ